jgi:hypothetical protein
MRKLVCLLPLLLAVGCIRPYDVPEFAEIKNNESAYLIPLEGATKEQKKFESEEYLETRKVAIKRVQIPHRWVKTGRILPSSGHYMDTVRLIVVNRSPVTREWTADEDSGTSNKNDAIWIESKDSVGFSVGFNCTAYINTPDTSKFLYMYPSTVKDQGSKDVDKSVASLAHIMDTEIRARIQQVAMEVSSKDDLDDLRAKKQSLIDAVRADVVPFFASRGITITTIGMFGGFEYENEAIQTSIDNTFIAQQEKVITEAQFEAQGKKN